jgi:hypothetical protein
MQILIGLTNSDIDSVAQREMLKSWQTGKFKTIYNKIYFDGCISYLIYQLTHKYLVWFN